MELVNARREYTFRHQVRIPEEMHDPEEIDNFVDMDIFSQPLPDLDGEIAEFRIRKGNVIHNGIMDVAITIYTDRA